MTERPTITRAVPLLDLEVGRDGRTVTAYAATFDDPYEVRDGQGHYMETIARTAFNRQISHGIGRAVPLFNHGLTIHGTPSERDSDPLGVCVAMRAEAKGLLTVTKFGTTPRNEEVLTMLKDGTVTTYSFQGSVFREAPIRRSSTGLPIRERLDLSVKDYGPGILTVNRNAGLVAIRSTALLAEELAQLTPEERAELLAQLSTPPASPAPGQEPSDTPPADEAPDTSRQIIDLLEAEAAQRRRRLGH